MTSPTETFCWRPPVRTIAYTRNSPSLETDPLMPAAHTGLGDSREIRVDERPPPAESREVCAQGFGVTQTPTVKVTGP
ncbi:hypothetical protein GCM10017688_28590 [Streptomyces ramulosus]